MFILTGARCFTEWCVYMLLIIIILHCIMTKWCRNCGDGYTIMWTYQKLLNCVIYLDELYVRVNCILIKLNLSHFSFPTSAGQRIHKHSSTMLFSSYILSTLPHVLLFHLKHIETFSQSCLICFCSWACFYFSFWTNSLLIHIHIPTSYSSVIKIGNLCA